MVSTVHGEFRTVDAAIDYEPGKLDDLSVSVTVDMNSVDTRNADRDAHLRSSDFFDMDNHPTMTFTSKKVKTGKRGHFSIIGDLTLRGVKKEVTLEGVGLDQVVTDPWGNTRVGATASTTLSRSAFGVSWNQALEAGGVMVGDEVTIQIDAEFVRQPDEGAATEG